MALRDLGAAAIALLGCASRVVGQGADPTIDTVIVVTHNVFEPAGRTPHFVARLGDALHVKTRPSVVRSPSFSVKARYPRGATASTMRWMLPDGDGTRTVRWLPTAATPGAPRMRATRAGSRTASARLLTRLGDET